MPSKLPADIMQRIDALENRAAEGETRNAALAQRNA